jgi:hypothetical protein
MGESGWTVETLKEYADTRITSIEARQKEMKVETDSKFSGVNEFRGALADAQRNLMPRSEAEVQFNALRAEIATLKENATQRAGEGVGRVAGWGWAVAVVLLALAVYLGLQGRTP